MLHRKTARRALWGLFLLLHAALAGAQTPSARSPVEISAADENGVAVAGASITVIEPGRPPLHLRTNFAGRLRFTPQTEAPYSIQAAKPGFYQSEQSDVDPAAASVRIVLTHEQIVQEQVNVTASSPGIDPARVSDEMTLNTPEIVNIPYQTSRDIRYLLPFYPGVVMDSTEQVHVNGAETWETLDTIDGFDVRSPGAGTLDMRVSADAVRSIDQEGTRYPVEFGRSTGGVIAFYTGMGDNKFRFNATNFIPSARDLNGIRFDKFVPRFTFSGPLKRNRAWWFDGLELEYDNNYIAELPANADTNHLARGSNLVKVQTNLTPKNIVTAGLLFNDYHSPYEGLSALVPQVSTTKRNVIGWLPYLRDQWSFVRGALLDIGVGEMRYRDGHEPHGDTPYEITPELTQGSYFENLTSRSDRLQGSAELYLPPLHLAGQHDLRLGGDLDQVNYNQNQVRTPVTYLREDRSRIRQSTFAAAPPFTIHNPEWGAYAEDRWKLRHGWLIEPGLRFDWDSIVRQPLFSPRIAGVYVPRKGGGNTKISAGVGVYYDHTQLEYLAQTYAGVRFDTYFGGDGVTVTGPGQMTTFTVDKRQLRDPRALNWSIALEQKLPWKLYGEANLLFKRTADVFTFAPPAGPAVFAGNYQLTNARTDHYRSEEFDLRRQFAGDYTVFVAYTHSSARTSAALNYLPTPSPLGPQQSGPLSWDVPNRTISWGWLPTPLPRFRKSWDFVYLLDWRSGYPYTAVNAAGVVMGAAGAYRFPSNINFSPGLEWKFHFHGQYYGLRGVMENALDRTNPLVVNNVVDSPQFGTFSEFQGRALTARIRLIGAK